MANNSLSRTDKRIRADEPLCLRIVIPALEVVQPRLGVVNVAPVAEDIQVCNVRGRRDRVAARVSDLKEPAPAVINVFCRKRVAFRPQLKYITFDVFNEIIINVNLPDDIALNPYRKQNHFGFHAGKQTNHFLGLLQCEKKFTSSGKSIEVV